MAQSIINPIPTPAGATGTVVSYASSIQHLRNQVKGHHLCMTPSGKIEEDVWYNEASGHPWLGNIDLVEDEDIYTFFSQFKPLIASQRRNGEKNYPPMRWSLRNGLAVYSWLPLSVEQKDWCLNQTLEKPSLALFADSKLHNPDSSAMTTYSDLKLVSYDPMANPEIAVSYSVSSTISVYLKPNDYESLKKWNDGYRNGNVDYKLKRNSVYSMEIDSVTNIGTYKCSVATWQQFAIK